MAVNTPHQSDDQLSAVDSLSVHNELNLKKVHANRAAMLFALILPFLPQAANARNMSSLDLDFYRSIPVMPTSANEAPEKKLQMKDLLKMPWKEIEARLKDMDYEEVKEIADELVTVADDARIIPGLVNKIKSQHPLDTNDQNLILKLVEKYDISVVDIGTLKNVLNKQFVTERDSQFNLIAIKEVIKKQPEAVRKYIEIQKFQVSIMMLAGLYSDEWSQRSIERIQAFQSLESAIREYLEFLNQPAKR